MENKLWYYRTQQNLTIRDLSKKTGISVSNISKIENNQIKKVSLPDAIMLSEALEVDLYELFCIKNNKGGKLVMKKKRVFFNLICEEVSVIGGKIIHVDMNLLTIDDVHKVIVNNIMKYPNGKWELYPMVMGRL